ncbi:hypothetical protein EV368DRAFT_64761 [Lentinula lateritia]|uniref:Uncharacterized protein n=1 Tax=Lentinula aff. lateritia TaxID=2804960 RepID=A0ACC1TVH6_9AGAR|nr:hypothetical protein F5876DRAFT_67172 [Lentinula aff. lateritia]KAJ3852645.1 hypothetical protein EV368DRAFT_64761 [Lentinula lateritia]
MASAQNPSSMNTPMAMEPTATMDRFLGSGRTDSTIDDSPFGSTLNTPADEDVREPFEAIGQRLKELQTANNLEKQFKQMDNFGTCEVLALEASLQQDSPNIDPDSERHDLSSISPSQDYPQEEITQCQVQEEHNLIIGSLSMVNISRVAAEENFDESFINQSDTSMISDKLLCSFPTVPFSSPEIPNDNTMAVSPVPFSNELSRSLYNIQTQSARPSPEMTVSSPSIQNSNSPANSSMFFSPDLDHGFSAHLRASSLYSLPNAPITISPSITIAESQCSHYSEMEGVGANSVAQDITVLDPANEHKAADHLTLNSEPEYTFSVLRSLDLSPANLPVIFFKLACFVPWCALVGGTILLSPVNIEKVTFSPGIGVGKFRLDYVSLPPRNIHRFAHWTECAIPQLMTFLAAFGLGLWCLARTGTGLILTLTVVAVVLGQTVISWQDFDFGLGGTGRVGDKPLGEDDRESIWMVIRLYLMAEESTTWFNGRLEAGIFVERGSKMHRHSS